MSTTENKPCVLERLYQHFGSYGKVCRALEVTDSYTPRWRRTGYIPELFALAVDRLHVRDQWGEITVYTVLEEADAVRAAAYRLMQEIGDG